MHHSISRGELLAEIDDWADDFAAFHARFADLFGRKEPRSQAVKYTRGLIASVERSSTWQIAEATGDRIPDATQRLLYRVDWDADAARDRLQQFVIETYGDPDGIGVVDETGFLKKGAFSVGVQRQYSGTAGRIENCQIGVFLSYASSHGHVFLDRRLYLPQSWCADQKRCDRAKVPASVIFQTKDQLARAMLEHAWAQGVPMRWVTGDEVYGDAATLRDSIAAHGRLYVLAVRSNTVVWLERPRLVEPTQKRYGPPATDLVLAADAPPLTSVAAIVSSWPDSAWQRLTIADGEKGPRTYDWACRCVVEPRQSMPGPDGWLLARRSISDPTEIAYYLSNAPDGTPLQTMARVASARYTVEQCIEEAKGDAGLDAYQIRHWQSWHRHITLSMMAHAWLASIRDKEAKKGDASHSLPI
jgi:SRSO17 transposase